MAKHSVAGSDKALPEGAHCVGQCDPREKIEVIVMLRRRDEAGFRALMQKIDAGEAPVVPVSREAFAQRFGASPDDRCRRNKVYLDGGSRTQLKADLAKMYDAATANHPAMSRIRALQQRRVQG